MTVLCALMGLAGGVAAGWSAAGRHVDSADAGNVREKSGGSRAGGRETGHGTAKAGGSPDTTASEGSRAGIAEILALRGFRQMERFGGWLPEAGTAELREFLLAMKKADIFDPTLSDMLFLRWVELDPDDALASGRECGYSKGWWAWGKLDPERALAAAAASDKEQNGVEALRGIAQADPERARQFMEQYPQFVDRVSLEGMVTGLFRSDPRAAAETALRMNSSESRYAVKGWAKREPEKAFAWALEIESPGQRSQMLSAIVQEWEDTSPERVGPALEMLPAGKAKNILLAEHAGRLALTDTAGGIAFAQHLPLPAVRQAALGAIAQSLARDRPQEAVEYMRQQDWKTVNMAYSTGVTNNGFYDALLTLARSMPEDAMALAITSTHGNSVPRQTFDVWANTDVVTASAWLAAQPAEQRNPQCVEALVSHLGQPGPDRDFESAVRWAVTIPHSENLLWSVGSVFQSWRQADPLAAEQALQLPGVPEKVRTEFLHSKSTP